MNYYTENGDLAVEAADEAFAKLNVEGLKKLRDQVMLVGPKHFNMGSFVEGGAVLTTSLRELSCGTTGCLAGWMVAIERGAIPEKMWEYTDFDKVAAGILNLPQKQYSTSTRLFYLDEWPEYIRNIARAWITAEYGPLYESEGQCEYDAAMTLLDDMITGATILTEFGWVQR